MELLPQQIELWYIIPAIRREFAVEMAKHGIKGSKTAEILGLTKSAVSQYFSKSRAVEFTFDQDVKKEIKYSVAKIMNGQEPSAEIQRIISLMRENKSICKFHHLKERLDKNCDICLN